MIECRPNVREEFYLQVTQPWTVLPWPEKTGIPDREAAATVDATSPQEALSLAISASQKISASARVLIWPKSVPSNMEGENGQFIGWKLPKHWLVGHRGF